MWQIIGELLKRCNKDANINKRAQRGERGKLCVYAEEWQRVFFERTWREEHLDVSFHDQSPKPAQVERSNKLSREEKKARSTFFCCSTLTQLGIRCEMKALKNNKNNLPFISKSSDSNKIKTAQMRKKSWKNLSVECRRSNCYWCWLNYQLACSEFLLLRFFICFTPSVWLFMVQINFVSRMASNSQVTGQSFRSQSTAKSNSHLSLLSFCANFVDL